MSHAPKSSKQSLRLWPRQLAGMNSYHENQRCSDMRPNCGTDVVKCRNVMKNDHLGTYPARSIAISSVATCHAKRLQHEVLRSNEQFGDTLSNIIIYKINLSQKVGGARLRDYKSSIGPLRRTKSNLQSLSEPPKPLVKKNPVLVC